MNQFSVKEIETMLQFHQERADRYHNIFNSPICSATITISTEGTKSLKIFALDPKATLAMDKIRECFYELSVFHATERVKWQIFLEQSKTDNL